MHSARGPAARIALVYAAIAATWILVSGYLVFDLPSPLEGQVEIAKGLLFVAVTSFALYSVVRLWVERYSSEARHAEGAERVLRQVVETVPVGVLLTNDDGVITFVNPAAEDLLGVSAEACVGQILEDMCAGEEGLRAVNVGELLRTGSADGLEFAGRDGAPPHAVIARAAQVDPGMPGSGWVVAIADITDTHRQSRRYERLSRGYRTVSELATSMARARDEHQLLAQLSEQAVERGGFRAAWSTIIDQASGRLETVAMVGLGERAREAANLMASAMGHTTSWMPSTLQEGEIYVSNDLARDPANPWSAAALAEGFGSSAAFAAGGSHSVVASVTFLASEPGFFDQDQVALIKMLRDNVSFALERIGLDRKRLEAEEALERSEATYRQLFQDHPQPLLVVDRESLKFLAANESAVRKYGYSHEQFSRMSVFDISPVGDRPQIEDLSKRERPVFEDLGVWANRDRSGREFPVQLWVHTITWHGRPADLLMVQEVATVR